MVSVVAAAQVFAADIIIDDGEGTSAEIGTFYDYEWGNTTRQVQLTDEEAIVPVVGDGATKITFETYGSPWGSVSGHTYSTPQDWSSMRYGAMDFWWYYRRSSGSTADRATGRTQSNLLIYLLDD